MRSNIFEDTKEGPHRESSREVISEIKIQRDVREPRVCSVKEVMNFNQIEGNNLKTRLQKNGTRKEWFPVIDFGSLFLNKHLSPSSRNFHEKELFKEFKSN